jgi:hypothetical protein
MSVSTNKDRAASMPPSEGRLGRIQVALNTASRLTRDTHVDGVRKAKQPVRWLDQPCGDLVNR